MARSLALAPVALPVAVARWILPRREELPVYLGAGALAAVGLVEWPVAAAAALGYAVLRRTGGVSVTLGAGNAPRERTQETGGGGQELSQPVELSDSEEQPQGGRQARGQRENAPARPGS